MCPPVGTQPATQACALTRNRTTGLLVHKLVLNPLSHTSQGCVCVCFIINPIYAKCYTFSRHISVLSFCLCNKKYVVMPKLLVYFSSICSGLAITSLPHATVFHMVLILAQIFPFISVIFQFGGQIPKHRVCKQTYCFIGWKLSNKTH